MTRIPGTIWTPATGAGATKYYRRQLDQILYTVNHDAQGYRSFLQRGHAIGREASWLITNLVDGTRLQHYELEAGTWTSGGRTQNIAGVATEHESQGDMSLPITQAQVNADLETELFLATVCPNLRPPVLGQGRREHGELTNGATACPNGRIQPLYDYEEDDMPLDAADKEYLAGLMRGAVQAIGNKVMNNPMKAGDPDWVPPVALKDVLTSIGATPTLSLTDDDLKKLAKYVNDDAAERMRE